MCVLCGALLYFMCIVWLSADPNRVENRVYCEFVCACLCKRYNTEVYTMVHVVAITDVAVVVVVIDVVVTDTTTAVANFCTFSLPFFHPCALLNTIAPFTIVCY